MFIRCLWREEEGNAWSGGQARVCVRVYLVVSLVCEREWDGSTLGSTCVSTWNILECLCTLLYLLHQDGCLQLSDGDGDEMWFRSTASGIYVGYYALCRI